MIPEVRVIAWPCGTSSRVEERNGSILARSSKDGVCWLRGLEEIEYKVEFQAVGYWGAARPRIVPGDEWTV